MEEQADGALVSHGTPSERIAMVWQVTMDVWASSGRPFPVYSRHEIPGRLIRTNDG